MTSMETILFDRQTILALKAVLFLARHHEDHRYYKVKEMAAALGVSRSYLARIIQALVKNKILQSSTGPTGGFYIPEENLDLTVNDVIAFTRYDRHLDRCVMEWPGCSDNKPCPLHHSWLKFKEGIRRDLARMTVRQARKLLYDRLEVQ